MEMKPVHCCLLLVVVCILFLSVKLLEGDESSPQSCINYNVIHYDLGDEKKVMENPSRTSDGDIDIEENTKRLHVQVSSMDEFEKTTNHSFGECSLVDKNEYDCSKIAGYNIADNDVFNICTKDPDSNFCMASNQQCTNCRGDGDCEQKLKPPPPPPPPCSRCRSNRCPFYGPFQCQPVIGEYHDWTGSGYKHSGYFPGDWCLHPERYKIDDSIVKKYLPGHLQNGMNC